MRTLHSYLTRQVLYTVLMTVGVFTFVLLLGNVLKEILALLVNRQATLGMALQAIALLIPYVMAFALPMGLLTATLLVFGRFSADQELTAVRAGGISLVSLITPVLLLSLAFSGLCALFNMQIAPQCRVAYKRLIMTLSMQNPRNFISEDRFIEEIPGVVLYVRKRNGDQLKDVRLYELQDNIIISRFRAPEGEIVWETNRVFLRLKDGTAEKRMTGEPIPLHQPAPTTVTNEVVTDGITNLVINEVIVVTNEVAGVTNDISRWQIVTGELETPALDLSSFSPTHLEPKLSEMSFQQLLDTIRTLNQKRIDATPALVQLHRQLAFSFASFGFTLIGIPLGIRAHRRETTIGVAISLLLVLGYYSFFILGQALEGRPQLAPHLLLWIPNLLFQAIGALLLWRADRG